MEGKEAKLLRLPSGSITRAEELVARLATADRAEIDAFALALLIAIAQKARPEDLTADERAFLREFDEYDV